MVVSKVEFNQAMEQVNDAFRDCWKRIEELEKQVAELKPKTRAKAPAKKEEEDAA